jgi:signal transduction histidine kinase
MEEEKRHLREKEMLVKDLHDGIGGIVTNIAMLGQYGLMQGEVSQCHETVARMVELASAGVTEIRSFMNSLESGESAWSDLLAEVKGYAERMFEPYHISLAVSSRIADGLPPIGLFRYANIVRICREAITNIIKHAGADSVTLFFSVTAERFELSIVDDGVGYFPDTIKRRGLANMFSRARAVGAELTLRSSSDGSTVSLDMALT